ncbi:MAG: lysine 6-monooxygenase [Cyanobacteria bacterium QH_8_48_120]|jgi:lysine N6-hydroxylase|nr:MAG: lysine 6-monooxygenase [Cyanobacteria bacterium QH_1_48_107]PSO77098.1 MAG: lysine 6-monooxygenase [Cyanobacteria bacterium QH_8_48_120]PSP25848.1 MAG: lysine 6-monooxygenase [Cyanobacteria bacterium SW_4_48_29]
MNEKIYDLLGVGIGPFNLGLAALLEPISEIDAVFLEQKREFQWHPGLLMEGTTIQVPFLADLVTMADPCSRFSFLNYLHAHSRLYQFYFWEAFHIPRREYNHYCQWVAGQLRSCRFSQRVEAITWQEGTPEGYFQLQACNPTTGEIQSYYARHLVLGVGSIPRVPPCFQAWLSQEKIFHAAEFLQKRDRCRHAGSITVIGSGQSAAEVFYELLQEQESCGYRLEWHTRSPGFFPMEYSQLGLEHFSPDYIHYFYHLPPQQRDHVRGEQDLLYKGISFGTIADIYNLLYERSVGGNHPEVRLLSSLEVKEVEKTNSGYRLGYRQWQQEEYFTHETDCIILATGYRHAIPDCIDGVRSLLQWDSQNRYVVNFDYRLALTRDIPNQIFLQNGELHTHGVGAPDLGLGAHRNSVIINTLTGRTIYPVQQRNVFQEFGVKD